MGTVWHVFGFFKRPKADWLVVGLGNPGAEYARTKHNVGFLALDELPKLDGVARCKPQTYMNLSGEAVAPLARKFNIPPERIIVLHDELDLPAGKTRVKLGGNENGHNGLKSITQHLGTRDYIRVRIGIGHPGDKSRVTGYVLGNYAKSEMEPLADLLGAMAAEAERLADGDDARFMNDVAMRMHQD